MDIITSKRFLHILFIILFILEFVQLKSLHIAPLIKIISIGLCEHKVLKCKSLSGFTKPLFSRLKLKKDKELSKLN